jgi:hypothetical protein
MRLRRPFGDEEVGGVGHFEGTIAQDPEPLQVGGYEHLGLDVRWRLDAPPVQEFQDDAL